MFILRGIAIVSLLLLQNCAKNMELGPDGLGHGAQTLSASQYRLLASSAPGYDANFGRSPRKKRARPSSVDENHFLNLQDRRENENSNAEMLPELLHASIKIPSPDDALPAESNSKFLELLGEQDAENRILKQKTLICRGC